MCEPTHVSLHVVRVETQKPSRKHYVEIKIDKGQKTRKTLKLQSDGRPSSDAMLHLDTSVVVNVYLKKSKQLWKDQPIAYTRIDIMTLLPLLQKSAKQDARLGLNAAPAASSTASQDSVGTIHICVEGIGALTRAQLLVRRAENDSKMAGILEDKADSVNMVIDALDQIMKIVGIATQIHPLLEVSWRAATVLYTLVSHQVKTDSKLKEMIEAMKTSLDFTGKADKLSEKADTLRPVIKELIQSAVECSQFVIEYTSCKFLVRIARLSSNRVMDGYISRFADLRNALHSAIDVATLEVVIGTQTAAVDARDVAIDIQSQQLLENVLVPTKLDGSKISDKPRCLEGTRKEYLDKIKDMLFQETFTERNAVWLTGAAGSGKSTIAVTIADICDEMRCPAAYLFFERGKGECSYTIRNVAYKIATLHPIVAPHIVTAARENLNISGNELNRQFRKLILEPIQASAGELKHPVVIILDALDESGTEGQRGRLLQLLKDGLMELPSMVRLFVTSRPEKDIMEFLSSASHIHRIELECMSEKSRADVDHYLRKEMISLVGEEAPKGWVWKNIFHELSSAAGGLFIWASTAVKMVRNSDDCLEKLESLLGNIRTVGGGIDSLYSTVLEESGISWTEPKSRDLFKRIFGLVLFAKEALSDTDIAGFLGVGKRKVELTLGRLRTVLSYEPGGPIYLHHASLADYILSFERCGGKSWWIDELEEKRLIAERCFDVMEQGLRFNICGIESSFMRNVDVPGIQVRIKANIPPHLDYACRFWAVHFSEASEPAVLLSRLKAFAHNQLLYWMEVLSLTKQFIRVAGEALREACLNSSSMDVGLSSFLWAAYRLASVFAYPISQSVPHIYLAAVSIWTGESRVADHYLRIHPVVQIHAFGTRGPSQCMMVIEGHSRPVMSVAFSRDGRRVASGSYDLTVRVWDADSGKLVADPFKGHRGVVVSIAFSPCNNRIASGSLDGTVRVWDADTGKHIFRPLKHRSLITSVAFSLDGRQIASRCFDKMVRIWDANTGKPLSEPFQGRINEGNSNVLSPDGRHRACSSTDGAIRILDVSTGNVVSGLFEEHTDRVGSLMFSPDGQRIASGSDDGTVIVWSVRTGQIISGPFRGHNERVNSVSFSPEGRRIASASDDGTVRIWDADVRSLVSDSPDGHASKIWSVAFSPDRTYIASGCFDGSICIWEVGTGKLVSGPFRVHSKLVYSLVFSPDGRRIASGSNDRTICIWDVNTGKLILGPLKGHADWVNSVAFSPTGRKVVSGSNDKTIRVWNVDNGELVLTISGGHTDRVQVVAFSPSGRHIASGSRDKTIRIWDANTGELVSGPLEGHEGEINSVAFSSDSEHVASGSDDKTIRVWDANSGQLVSSPFKGHTNSVYPVAFSPDRVFLTSSSLDGTIRIWNTKSGELVAGPFQGCSRRYSSIMFARDGSRVLSCFFGAGIRIIEIESSEFVAGDVGGFLTSKSTTSPSLDLTHPSAGSLSHDIVTTRLSSKERAISHWILSDDGWVLGRGGELLTWIPEDMRQSLWTARTTAYFNCQFSMRLDLVNSPLGEDWCRGFPLSR